MKVSELCHVIRSYLCDCKVSCVGVGTLRGLDRLPCTFFLFSFSVRTALSDAPHVAHMLQCRKLHVASGPCTLHHLHLSIHNFRQRFSTRNFSVRHEPSAMFRCTICLSCSVHNVALAPLGSFSGLAATMIQPRPTL